MNTSDQLKYKDNDVVSLNVGGESFKSFYGTLAKSNYFKVLLNDDSMPCKTIVNDKKEIFVDRSDDLFQGILYFLRTGLILCERQERLQALQNEATFYQLDEMVQVIDSILKRQKSRASQVEILVKDTEFLNAASASRLNYLVQEVEDNVFKVYQIVGVINVYYSVGSNRAGNLLYASAPKILLHSTKKKAYQFTQA